MTKYAGSSCHALACALALAAGCGTEAGGENVAVSQAGLTSTINVGDGTSAYTRYVNTEESNWECQYECAVPLEREDGDGGWIWVCNEYEITPTCRLLTAELYRSAAEAQAQVVFNAYVYEEIRTARRCVDYEYELRRCLAYETYTYTYVDNGYAGCGRKAAQNVLHWFNIDRPQSQIDDFVAGFTTPNGQIATYPDQLQSGLQRLLDLYAAKPHRVLLHAYGDSSRQPIVDALAEGYPVIALVDGGSHWVMVSAYNPSRGGFFISDYSPTTARWVADLDLTFDPLASLWSSTPGVNSSYVPGTYLTIRPL